MYPAQRRDPRVFVAVRRSSASTRDRHRRCGVFFVRFQSSSCSKTLHQAFRHKDAPPAHPMAAPARAFNLAGAALLLNCHSPCARFVKELHRKNLQGMPAKFFAPLTTAENYIINTRAERFPAPRLNRKTAPLSSPSPPRLLVCTCSHLIYPLANGYLLPP